MSRPAGRRNARVVAVLLAALAAAIASCSASASTATPGSSFPAGSGGLAALQVVPEDTGAHYKREDWPHWSQQPGGCDTRETVLREQGQNVTTGRGCRITDGRWTSAYDGVIVTDASKLDLDHLVPLAEVQRSGRIVDGRRVGPRAWT